MQRTDIDDNTAWANYALLKTLPHTTRICVLQGHRLELDTRWLGGPRRRWTGESRKDLELPLRLTFARAASAGTIPVSEYLETLNHVESRLTELYSGDEEIRKMIDEIRIMVTPAEETTQRLKETPKSDPVPTPPIMIELPENLELVESTPHLVHRKQLDVRLNIADFENANESEPAPESGLSLYDIFPCLRYMVKWFKRTFP